MSITPFFIASLWRSFTIVEILAKQACWVKMGIGNELVNKRGMDFYQYRWRERKLVFSSYETTVHVYFGSLQWVASDHVSTMDSNITQIYKMISKTHSCKVEQWLGRDTFHNPIQRKKKIPGIRLNLLFLHPKSSEQLWKKAQIHSSYFSVSVW